MRSIFLSNCPLFQAAWSINLSNVENKLREKIWRKNVENKFWESNPGQLGVKNEPRFFKEGWTLKLLVVNKSIYYWANLGTTNRE